METNSWLHAYTASILPNWAIFLAPNVCSYEMKQLDQARSYNSVSSDNIAMESYLNTWQSEVVGPVTLPQNIHN